MISKNRLKIDRNMAINESMRAIMELNGNIVIEERWSKEGYRESLEFLRGVRKDIDNALDEKIKEIEKIAERTV